MSYALRLGPAGRLVVEGLTVVGAGEGGRGLVGGSSASGVVGEGRVKRREKKAGGGGGSSGFGNGAGEGRVRKLKGVSIWAWAWVGWRADVSFRCYRGLASWLRSRIDSRLRRKLGGTRGASLCVEVLDSGSGGLLMANWCL